MFPSWSPPFNGLMTGSNHFSLDLQCDHFILLLLYLPKHSVSHMIPPYYFLHFIYNVIIHLFDDRNHARPNIRLGVIFNWKLKYCS